MNGGTSQRARIMDSILTELDCQKRDWNEAVDKLAVAAADALYGPLIRELERKIAERDAQ